MDLRRIFLELVICVAVILSEMGAAAVEFPIAKSLHCQDRCGNVRVPYPFGTTENCSLNDDFLISCDNSSGRPQPIAGENVIVKNISMNGEFDILMYIAKQCYESGEPVVRNKPSINYPAFTISNTKNKFFTIGCDTYAYLNAFRNDESFSIGCMSICKSLRNVENGSCTGIGCCQVDIPKGLKNFTLEARSYYNHINVSEFNPCSFAFVAKEDDMFNFSASYLESLRGNETYSMVLDWAIGIETCETAPSKLGYVCGQNASCDDPPEGVNGYRCKCKEGYEGNPYLSDGCQDINECEADTNPCNITTSTCNNINGSFTCTCRVGYEGDGKIINGSTSCRLKARANRSKINIIIPLAISIGLIGLFMGGSSIYFGLQRRKLIKLKDKFFQQNGGTLLQQKLSNYRASTEVVKIFSAEELEKATNNYDESRIIGQGGYGTVYRGVLPDNQVVAIKKSKICDQSQIEQFINESY